MKCLFWKVYRILLNSNLTTDWNDRCTTSCVIWATSVNPLCFTFLIGKKGLIVPNSQTGSEPLKVDLDKMFKTVTLGI